MKTGNHVGKLVLVNYKRDGEGKMQPLPVKAFDVVRKLSNQADKTILVTGGTGGFGHMLITHMATTEGARHFIIPTRTGDIPEVRRRFKHVLDLPGTTIQFIKADMGVEADVERLVNIAKASTPPLKKIVHAAGISLDCTLHDMEVGLFHTIADCKALAAWRLHELTMDMDLEDFIVISSTSSVVGTGGVGFYAGANSFLNGLIRLRRSMGLPGASFGMASLVDVGLIADRPETRRMQSRLGFCFMYSQEALNHLNTGLRCGLGPMYTLNHDPKYFSLLASAAPFSHINKKHRMLGMSENTNRALQPADIVAIIIQEIKAIIGVEEVSPSTQLLSLGLDSFSFVSTSTGSYP